MQFWQVKNAEKPNRSSLLRFDDTRDSYDRCDYYNTYGVAVYFMLKMRKAWLTQIGAEDDGLTSDRGLGFW
jgi:hypothetical protein